jgi:hypothetical protein
VTLFASLTSQKKERCAGQQASRSRGGDRQKPEYVSATVIPPHWPETRQHFRPMRLLMPLTVRKDDRGVDVDQRLSLEKSQNE